MINVRASVLEARLKELARITGKSKSHFVRVALQAYLDGQTFDSVDYMPLENETLSTLMLGHNHGVI
jgi:predicted DNA-binding protein